MIFARPDGAPVEIHAARRRVSELRTQGRRKTAARDAEFWGMYQRGWTIADIAAMFGMPVMTVHDGIRRAEALRQKLAPDRNPPSAPLFGCRPFAAEHLESSHSPTPAAEPVCHVCRSAIAPGDDAVCMRCHESGHDFALAEQIGAAITSGQAPTPAPPSRPGHTAPKTPRLTLAHRIELARTPQGAIWLESIGQLPTEAEMNERAARKADRRRNPA